MQTIKAKIFNKTVVLSWVLAPVLPVLVFLVMSFMFLRTQVVFAQGSVELLSAFPADENMDYRPSDLSTDSDGNLYVLSVIEQRVRKYDSSGNFITNILDNNGQYTLSYEELSVDPSGNIFVFDYNGYQVLKYDSLGTLVTSWGTYGSGDGEFGSFGGMATDSAGNVFISEVDGHRIQKFDNNGTYLTKWGTNGSGNGQFNRPLGVTVDRSTDNVFVTDMLNYRIQKFDNNGTYLTKWGSQGSGNGQFNPPFKITADSGGNIYVTDGFNYRIQKFDSSGTYLTKWGSNGSGDGQFATYLQGGMAVGPGDRVYVADEMNNRVQEFDSSGVFVQHFVYFPKMNSPQDITVYDNTVYVANSGSDKIMRFDKATGAFIDDWGSAGSGNGQFSYVSAIASDSVGNIYTLERGWSGLESRVQKFDSDGNYLLQWGSAGSGNGQFLGAYGIAVDNDDNIYVLDSSNQRVQKFDSDGNYLLQWGSSGSGDGQFYLNHAQGASNGIAVDSQNNVYVSDSGNARVQKFDSDGNYLLQWGSFGDSNNQFKYQRGIDIDSNDTVYVLDVWATSRNWLKRFDSSGNFLSSTLGAEFGFSNGNSSNLGPQNLHVDTDDKIYVMDTGYSYDNATGNVKVLEYQSTLSIETTYLEPAYFMQAYSQAIEVADAAGPTTFTIISGSLPDGLNLDQDTGEITGELTQSGYQQHDITVEVTDGVTTVSQGYTIDAYGSTDIEIFTETLPSGDINSSYNEAITYTGGEGQVTSSVSSGAIPPGLVLVQGVGNVTIDGTPTQRGLYTFTITIEDGYSSDSQEYTIYIRPSDTDTSIVTALNGDGLSIGQPASYTVTASNHGPDSLDPTGSGSSSVTLFFVILVPSELTLQSVTHSGSFACQYLTTPPFPYPYDQYSDDGVFAHCALSTIPNDFLVGQIRQLQVNVVAGPGITPDTALRVVAINSGDPDYQLIEDTLLAGQDMYNVNSNNVCNYSGVHPGSCLDVIDVTTESLPDVTWSGISPDAYSQQVESTRDPYMSYSVLSGALPPGLSLSPSGEITGNPQGFPGTYTFTVLATENSSKQATEQLSITVPDPPPLVITTTELDDGQVGTAYVDEVYAANVQGDASYSVVSGSLPPGLSLTTIDNDYAQITGTPTQAGDWTFTVQAEDDFNTHQQELEIYVAPAPTPPPPDDPDPLSITTLQLDYGVVGVSYSDNVRVVNQVGDVGFTVVDGGSLPPGLQLVDMGDYAEIVGTPTSVGKWTFSVRATDTENSAVRAYSIPVYTTTTVPSSPNPGGNTEVDPDDLQEVIAPQPQQDDPSGTATAVRAGDTPKSRAVVIATAILRAFPWLLLIMLLLLGVVYFVQALAQVRATKRAKQILANLERLVHEKKTFIDLASHYMRTPMTVLKGSIELAVPLLPVEHIGSIQGTLAQLDRSISGIVNDIASDRALNQVQPPQQVQYNASRFWRLRVITPALAAIFSLGLAVLLRSRYESIGQQTEQYLTIAVSILVLSGFLYVLSSWYRNATRQRLQTQELQRYQSSIDYARNQFILAASDQLQQPVTELERLMLQADVVATMQGSPAQKMVTKALRDLKGTLDKFTLASHLQRNTIDSAQPQTVSTRGITEPIVDRVRSLRPTVTVNESVSDIPRLVKSPELLSIALQNIVENAADYNISTEPVEISENHSEQLQLTVTDHGVGIEPERLDTLFKPFGRIEDAEDFSRQGMGMGLFLSKLIMDYMNGKIIAQSTPGKGTSVSLTLP